jgi:uncharacterized protein YjbI with pentapeptide repeats
MITICRRDKNKIILYKTEKNDLNELNFSNINLEGGLLSFQSAQRCDFTNANLVWTHWRQSDISGSTLNNANLTKSSLVFAKLRYIRANNVTMNCVLAAAADFSGSIMIGASMNDAYFAGCDFTRCDLSKSEMKHTNLERVKFIQTYLRESILSYSWFSFVFPSERQLIRLAVFQKTDISKSIFYRTDLRGLDLTDTIHEKANFENAFYDIDTKWPEDVNPKKTGALLLYPGMNIARMDFNNVHLAASNLNNINASNINFHGAYLHNSDFSHGNLKQADLSFCNLNHTLFEKSNLREASLLNADVLRCNFRNADLRGADMRFDIKQFNEHKSINNDFTLKNAKYDKTTLWPDGFDPKEWDR